MGLVFRPQRGDTMTGVVTKVGSNHIGLLVANTFNASITSDNMGDSLTYNAAKQAWISKTPPKRAISMGSTVQFTVTSFHEAPPHLCCGGAARGSHIEWPQACPERCG